MGLESLKTKLSGGASNSDVSLSVGGVMSSTIVLSQSATLTAEIPGVVVTDAAGNTDGTGTLTYTALGKTLKWTEPGTAIPGTAVSIGSNGVYVIRGNGLTAGYVVVTVTSSQLSSVTSYAPSVTVATQNELMLPAVDKDTAYAGATEYYCYYLHNTHGSESILGVQLRLATDTPGVDTLSVGRLTNKNANGTLDGVADTGATWMTYQLAGVDLTLGDLLFGDRWGFWVKRVIPSLTVDGVSSNTFKLRVTALT